MPLRMVSGRSLFALVVTAVILCMLIVGLRSNDRMLPKLTDTLKKPGQNSAGFSHISKIYDNVAGALASNYSYSYCTTSSVADTSLAHGWHPAEPATQFFWPGKPKPRGMNYTRGLAMARIKSEDVSWIEAASLDVTPYIYVVDDPDATLRVPMNKGNEVMAYLTYIIDHYDALPDISLFMHPHRFADHNDPILGRDAVELISRLNNDRVVHEGYVNLNCALAMGCPTVLQDPRTRQPWGDALLDFYTRLYPDRPAPFELSQPCCSQFAVSRERICATSRRQYESFRQWLLESRLSNYHSGRVWEYLWHVVFTGLEVRCPTEYSCYCDTYGVCFQGPAELDLFSALHRRVGEVEGRVRDVGAIMGSGLGDVKKLKEELQGLEKELAQTKSQRDGMRAAAVERGQDPKLRAELGNRKWNAQEE